LRYDPDSLYTEKLDLDLGVFEFLANLLIVLFL